MKKTTEKFLRLPQVCARTGYGRSSIYAKVERGEFPAPVKLGARAIAWPESAIDMWIHDRITEGQQNEKRK